MGRIVHHMGSQDGGGQKLWGTGKTYSKELPLSANVNPHILPMFSNCNSAFRWQVFLTNRVSKSLPSTLLCQNSLSYPDQLSVHFLTLVYRADAEATRT